MHPLAALDVPDGQVAIHWFEQSSYAIKNSAGTMVQIDPYFPHTRPPERYIHPEPPLDEAQLPTDFVLLTHAHSDHTHPETIERIWQNFPQARFIGPEESIHQILTETTVDVLQTIPIRAGDLAEMGEMLVYAVYAKPPAGDPAANIKPPDVTHLGYIVEVDGMKLYFSGDPINTFAEHEELIRPIALHQPDIGFLTNHPSEGEFPFFDGCVKMAQKIGLTHVVPAHRACFVKRDYDPQEWAAQFPADGPQPLIIPRNSYILYPSE
jgi:L-ascorbate metabolism protein UlaG (beta-lactamase superfamily)